MRRVALALVATIATVVGTAGWASLDATPAAAAAATAVSLYASASTAEVGSTVTLTAVPNGDLGVHYIDIWKTDGTYLWTCVAGEESSCSVDVTESTPGTTSYVAFIDDDPGVTNYPPSNLIATSNYVYVTWVNPPRASNTYCPSPTLSILEGNIGTIYDKLVVQQNASDTAICVRFDGLGVGYGGALVIGNASIGFPTTDGNVAACPTFIHQTVLGQLIIVATGGAPGQTWLCVQAGSVAVRVIVPTTGLPSVNWYADPPGSTPVPSTGDVGTPSVRIGRSFHV
jgi:hypothetical protein